MEFLSPVCVIRRGENSLEIDQLGSKKPAGSALVSKQDISRFGMVRAK